MKNKRLYNLEIKIINNIMIKLVYIKNKIIMINKEDKIILIDLVKLKISFLVNIFQIIIYGESIYFILF